MTLAYTCALPLRPRPFDQLNVHQVHHAHGLGGAGWGWKRQDWVPLGPPPLGTPGPCFVAYLPGLDPDAVYWPGFVPGLGGKSGLVQIGTIVRFQTPSSPNSSSFLGGQGIGDMKLPPGRRLRVVVAEIARAAVAPSANALDVMHQTSPLAGLNRLDTAEPGRGGGLQTSQSSCDWALAPRRFTAP